MLNKELLLIDKREALGKVTVSLDTLDPIFGTDVITVYKFTGSNFNLGPDDIIYVQFRKGEDNIQKIVYIPIGTELYLDAVALTAHWGQISEIKGFEYVKVPNAMNAYRLVNDTGTLVIAGHYD